MKFLKKSEFYTDLQRRFPFDRRGYFYDGSCSRLPERRLSTRVRLGRLARVSERLIALSRPRRLVAFNDQLVGWRGIATTRRFSPLVVDPSCSIQELVERHMHFRSRRARADNYYLTDSDLTWFVTFCHEGDWHLFGTHALVPDLSLA